MLSNSAANAELCTTQSQMQPAERDTLAATARSLAAKVQANDANGLKAQTIAEYASNFSGIANAVANASTKAKGTPLVEQLYLLDGTMIKKQPDGTTPRRPVLLLAQSLPAGDRLRHPRSATR